MCTRGGCDAWTTQGATVLTQVEFEQLTALTLRRKTAQALALRARIVLACAQDIATRWLPAASA